MTLLKKTCFVAAISFLFLPMIGCDSGGGAAPEGPQLGELEQFLADNPDIAAEPEEEGPGEDEG